MTSRFSFEVPGLLRSLWIRAFADWRTKIQPWVTDHERGERFQLTEDEGVMMDVLAENILEVMPFLSRNKYVYRENIFWKQQGIDVAKNRVLAAISNHHHGDPKEWDRFEAMTPEEWIDWLRAIAEN